MRGDTPSQTAAVVAAARALGRYLPSDARLVSDPYGLRFVYPSVASAIDAGPASTTAALRWFTPLRRWIVYMQVRTRVIDDVLCEFVAGGGRQVVILGAGYDCRAHRLAAHLAECAVFEVDHPSTQRRKRRILGAEGEDARVRYVTWDFESQPMSELAKALSAAGHRPALPTLTIWEGVTMYLTEPAIKDTVTAVQTWSSSGSRLVFTYLDRHLIDERGALLPRLTKAALAQVGEPWRWGWRPPELRGWLRALAFDLLQDVSMDEAAAVLLPPRWAKDVSDPYRRFSISGFERVAVAGR